MKQKLLKINILLLLLVALMPVYAQEKIELEGTWVLDSVRVKETTPDGMLEKTVLPGERWKFDGTWMTQFRIENNTVSYQDVEGYVVSGNLYSLQPDGKNNIFMVYGVPDVKTYVIQLVSDNRLLLFHSFSGSYHLKAIDVSWELYYAKKLKN